MVASETKGTIVFVGSRGGFRGEPDAPLNQRRRFLFCSKSTPSRARGRDSPPETTQACAYGASKLGMHHAAGSLAQALGPKGIRVCTVARRRRRLSL